MRKGEKKEEVQFLFCEFVSLDKSLHPLMRVQGDPHCQ